MPCRDAWPDSNETDNFYKKRADKLAKTLCKTRAFIISILEKDNPQIVERLTEEKFNFFLELKEEQKVHRDQDKQREIARLENKLHSKKNDAERIKELGGKVTDKVKDRIKYYEKRVEAVKASDPMNTDLY